MRKIISLGFFLLPLPAIAHHGVAGVGVAGLNGPGAPIESAASNVLPAGNILAYYKIDDAQFEKYDGFTPEADYSRFNIFGLGYGFTSWFSAYTFIPYNEKIDEAGGLNSRGMADLSVMGQIGWKYDNGFKLIPATESLDDLEDWHFSLFGGTTLPTGEANHRLSNNSIDPSKALGFGESSYSLGLTASKMLTDKLTFNIEFSELHFQEYRYADSQRMKFGTENRFNAAVTYRTLIIPEHLFRLDSICEFQYLAIGRDQANSIPQLATGGKIGYIMPGIRVYWQNKSFALGIKKSVWTNLNEGDQQQGSEGKEKYRLIFSASLLF